MDHVRQRRIQRNELLLVDAPYPQRLPRCQVVADQVSGDLPVFPHSGYRQVLPRPITRGQSAHRCRIEGRQWFLDVAGRKRFHEQPNAVAPGRRKSAGPPSCAGSPRRTPAAVTRPTSTLHPEIRSAACAYNSSWPSDSTSSSAAASPRYTRPNFASWRQMSSPLSMMSASLIVFARGDAPAECRRSMRPPRRRDCRPPVC